MKSVRPHVVLGLAFLALAACSSKDAAQTAGSSGASTAPAASSTAATSSAEPSAIEISNYKLDMDKMNKYSAAIRGFAVLASTDSAAAESLTSDGNESMSDMIARIDANPKAVGVLRKAGLDAKDYVWITSAWLQAAMTKGLLDSNPKAKAPHGQNLQNVEFLNAHKAELDAMQKGMESAAGDNG